MPLAGALAALEFGILVGRTTVVQVQHGGRATPRLGLASLSAPNGSISPDRAVILLFTLLLRVVASAVYAHGLQAHWRAWEGSAPGTCAAGHHRLWWSVKLFLCLSQCLRELVLTVWPALAPVHYLQHAPLAHRLALVTVVASLIEPEEDTWQGMNMLAAAGHGLRAIMHQDDMTEFARQAGSICVAGFIGHAWSLTRGTQPAARPLGNNMSSTSHMLGASSNNSAVDWPEEALRFLALYLALMLVYMAYMKLQGPGASQPPSAALRLHAKHMSTHHSSDSVECDSTITDFRSQPASKQPSMNRHRLSGSSVLASMPSQLPNSVGTRISPAGRPVAIPALQTAPSTQRPAAISAATSTGHTTDLAAGMLQPGRRHSMPLVSEQQTSQSGTSTRRASAVAQFASSEPVVQPAWPTITDTAPVTGIPHVPSVSKLMQARTSMTSSQGTPHTPHRSYGGLSHAVGISRQVTLHPLYLAKVVVVRLTGMAIFTAYSIMTLRHLLAHRAVYGPQAAWQLAFKIWPSTFLAPVAVLVQVAALGLALTKQQMYMKHHTQISNVVYFVPLLIRLLMLVAEPAGAQALGHVVTSLNPSTFIYFALSSLVRKDTWTHHALLLSGTGIVLLAMKATVLGMLPVVTLTQPSSIPSLLTALQQILQDHPSYVTVALVAALLHALLAQQPMKQTIRRPRQRNLHLHRAHLSAQGSPGTLPQLHEAPSGEVEVSASSHSSRSIAALMHPEAQLAAADSPAVAAANAAAITQQAENAAVAGLLSAAVSSHLPGNRTLLMPCGLAASRQEPPMVGSPGLLQRGPAMRAGRMRRSSADVTSTFDRSELILKGLHRSLDHYIGAHTRRRSFDQATLERISSLKEQPSLSSSFSHRDSCRATLPALQQQPSASDAAMNLLDSMVLDDPFKAPEPDDLLACDGKEGADDMLPGLSEPVTVLQEVLTDHPLSPQTHASEDRDRLASEALSQVAGHSPGTAKTVMRPLPSTRWTSSGRQEQELQVSVSNWGQFFDTGWRQWGQQSIDMVGATLLLLMRLNAAVDSLSEVKAATFQQASATINRHDTSSVDLQGSVGKVARLQLGDIVWHPWTFPIISQLVAISYSVALLYGIASGAKFLKQHRTWLWIGQLLGMAVLQQLALHSTHNTEAAGQPHLQDLEASHSVPAYLSHPVLSMVCLSVMWPLLGLGLGTYKVTLLIRLVLTLILACSFLLHTCLAEPELMGLMSVRILMVMVAGYAISHEALCAAPRWVNRMAAAHKLNKQQPHTTTRLLISLLRTKERTACVLQALLLALLLMPCSHSVAASLLSLNSPGIRAIRDTCRAILMRLVVQPVAPLTLNMGADADSDALPSSPHSSSGSQVVLLPAELVEPLSLVLLAAIAVVMVQALDLVTASEVQRDHWYQEQLRTLQALTEMRLDLLAPNELVQVLQEQLPGLFTGSMACLVLINYDQPQQPGQSEDGALPPLSVQARAATLASIPMSMPSELPPDCVALLASMLIRGQGQQVTVRDLVADAVSRGPQRRDAKRLQRHFTDMHVSSVVLVPLVTDGVVCGGLVALSPEPGAHDQQLLDVLHGLAALLGSVMLLSHALHEARTGDLIIADVMPPQVAEQLRKQVVEKTQHFFPSDVPLTPALSRPLHHSFAGIAKGPRGAHPEHMHPFSMRLQPNISMGGSDSALTHMPARIDAAAVVKANSGNVALQAQSLRGMTQPYGSSGHCLLQETSNDAHSWSLPAGQQATHDGVLTSNSGKLPVGSHMWPDSLHSNGHQYSSDSEAAHMQGPRARVLSQQAKQHIRYSADLPMQQAIDTTQPTLSAPLPGRVSMPGPSSMAPSNSSSLRRVALGAGEQTAPAVASSGQQMAYKQWHDSVTVLFCDIVGYTSMSQDLEPEQVMLLLHELFTKYDKLADKWGVYKVETIGDCYMACTGVIRPDANHAETLLNFAVDMVHAANSVSNPLTGSNVSVRVGLHSGRVMSGIVGLQRARYCLFGDTVNTASRMESTGMANHLQISEATFKLLPAELQTLFSCRGEVQVKGKGCMLTYLLNPGELYTSNSGTRLVHVPSESLQQ